MVSEKKIQTVKSVERQLDEYPVVGILNMHKLPARQLHEIREKLRGKAVIRMVKKRLIKLALKKKKLSALESHVRGEPALFLSRENPFRIAKILQASKSEAPAKPGDIAPRDIVVPAGPTNLSPGPVIGELQKVKIPAGVEGEKIVVKKDTVIVREGEEISEAVAGVLSKLNIQPMEIGLDLLAAWENGIVYGKDVLFVPEGFYLDQIKSAVSEAFNLSIYINYFTKENIRLLLGRAFRESQLLAGEAGIVSPSTIKGLLAKAASEAGALEVKLK
jgi:large subunit ribosomal protein L10